MRGCEREIVLTSYGTADLGDQAPGWSGEEDGERKVEEWGDERQRWAYNQEGWREKESDNPSFPPHAPSSPASMRGANFSGRHRPCLELQSLAVGKWRIWAVSLDAGGGGGGFAAAWPGSVGVQETNQPYPAPCGPGWAEIREPNAPYMNSHFPILLPSPFYPLAKFLRELHGANQLWL
jgi:hypothetical protein